MKEKYLANKGTLSIEPRYLEVFEFRMGIADSNTHTYKETGEKFGFSSTRARQLTERVIYELSKIK